MDLDRDMSHVIPTGSSLDSKFLFRRMEEVTFQALGPASGRRFADVDAGIGQDGRALESRGAWAVGVEPSARMTALARSETQSSPVGWVRAWSEALPFRTGSFDGAFCKGALDHFDDPLRCIEETARITAPDGRVVFAVANFESLGCRLASVLDRWASAYGQRQARGRRLYDVPADHFTRYDPRLLRGQLELHLVIESWTGVSLLWGVPGWSRVLQGLPLGVARGLLVCADRIARLVPGWADVIVGAGRLRRPLGA